VGGLPTKQKVIAFTSFPTDARPMLAATADALWKSDDGAKTWRRLVNAPAGVTALAIHPERREVVFAGTGDGRIFRSADRGASWQPTR
jgi:photosystem II stability/assembly factor-like uncharacterized protein